MNSKKSLPLISVIVPIYNVEPYLEKCINSILIQDYSNLEIILVDDGSKDNCGYICDQFALKDQRISVLHKENGGLSSARNAGLEIAKGEFITFIDSDDWIAPDMVFTLYNDLIENEADFSSIIFYQEFPDGKLIRNSNQVAKQVLNKEETFSCYLFNNYLTPCACGKLYKRDLWKEIRFPEGMLFEDQLTLYKIIDLSNRVAFNPVPKYYYLKREGSIGHSKFNEKTYDLYKAINEQYDFITAKYPSLKDDLVVAKITWELVFINMMLCSDKIDKNVIKDVIAFSRKNIKDIISSKYIGKLRKFQILLFSYCFSMYKKIYLEYKKKYKVS